MKLVDFNALLNSNQLGEHMNKDSHVEDIEYMNHLKVVGKIQERWEETEASDLSIQERWASVKALVREMWSAVAQKTTVYQ